MAIFNYFIWHAMGVQSVHPLGVYCAGRAAGESARISAVLQLSPM